VQHLVIKEGSVLLMHGVTMKKKILVCLLTAIEFVIWWRAFEELFLPMSFAPPQNTITSFFVRLLTSFSTNFGKILVPAPGFTIPWTSKLSVIIDLTFSSQFLRFLSPIISILWSFLLGDALVQFLTYVLHFDPFFYWYPAADYGRDGIRVAWFQWFLCLVV